MVFNLNIERVWELKVKVFNYFFFYKFILYIIRLSKFIVNLVGLKF